MHDSRVVANRFLEIANASDASLTPMQLLKLVYIAHGWSLGLHGRPLISDEVQAWQYGPVIPRLYNAIRDYRGRPVTQMIAVRDEELSPSERALIQETFDVYGDLSGPALSRLTHAADTPWHVTYEPNSFGIEIPNDLIEAHYKSLAA